MGFLGSLARAYLLDRLMGRQQRHRRGRHGYQPYGYRHQYPPRRRGGVRFFGPLPYYSSTTRRGTRISVGGCCLPIPLMVGSGLAATASVVRRRARR